MERDAARYSQVVDSKEWHLVSKVARAHKPLHFSAFLSSISHKWEQLGAIDSGRPLCPYNVWRRLPRPCRGPGTGGRPRPAGTICAKYATECSKNVRFCSNLTAKCSGLCARTTSCIK